VIPTLQERANIETVLTRVRAWLPEADVLIVDDGSTDGTAELAEAVGETRGQIEVLRRVGPRGLGPAYRAGFRIGFSEGYEIVVQMDADLSHDPEALPAMVGALRSGTDMAIGSRYVPGGDTPGWPARRRALSKAGGWYARTLLRLPVRDVTSGYRAYRTSLLRAMETDTVTTTGFGFQIDMTVRAVEAGAAITEIPIVFRDRSAGDSKMSRTIVVEALLMVTGRAFTGRRTPRHASPTLGQTSTADPLRTACVPVAVPEVRNDRSAHPAVRAKVGRVS
jgi:dolichol-phosphate mannosyltransferase